MTAIGGLHLTAEGLPCGVKTPFLRGAPPCRVQLMKSKPACAEAPCARVCAEPSCNAAGHRSTMPLASRFLDLHVERMLYWIHR